MKDDREDVMPSVWLLAHEYDLGGRDEVKFLGVYASRADGEAAIEQLRDQPGFRDHPDGFSLDEQKIGLVGWPEGFVTEVLAQCYVAVLVLRADVAPDDGHQPLFDVQYRLFWVDTASGADAEDAYRTALELGAAEECEYDNEYGQRVTWRFVGLHDLDEVDMSTNDSVEVYSELRRGNPPRIADKSQLTLFWKRENAGRTAREILGDE